MSFYFNAFCTVILFCTIPFWGKSQNAISTLGTTINDAGGSLSLTIGQVDYITLSSSNQGLNQGVQHPHEIFVILNTDNTKIDRDVTIYPNPTSEFVTISNNDQSNNLLYYELFDMQGKRLLKEIIYKGVVNVSFLEHLPGLYFMKILDKEEVLKVFKIIKQ